MTVPVTLSSRSFPSGAALSGGFSASLELPSGAGESVTCPAELGGDYAFMFWDVDGELYTTETVNFTATGAQFTGTAWYVPTGGGSGPSGVSVVAFSPAQDEVLPTSPIAVVTPESDQTGPGSASTGSSDVTITPEAVLYPYGKFQSWLVFGAATTESNGDLFVLAGQSALAIAVYAIPRPDPCQHILDELAGLGPIPVGTLQQVEAWFQSHPVVAHAWEQLLACQRANGEPETPPTVNGQPVPL